jgi:hypothetical protein
VQAVSRNTQENETLTVALCARIVAFCANRLESVSASTIRRNLVPTKFVSCAMFNRKTLLPIVLIACVGCRKHESTISEHYVPPPIATVDAGPVKLPATGMVCRGDRSYLWTDENQVSKIDAIRLVRGRDGNLYEGYKKLQSLSDRTIPAIPFPAGVEGINVAVTSARSFVVVGEKGTLDIHRDGAWKHATLPSDGYVFFDNAVEIDGHWWFAAKHGLFRETDAGVEKIDTPKGDVRGVAPIGKDVWVVTSVPDGFEPHVYVAKRDAKGRFEVVLTTNDYSSGFRSSVGLGSDRAAFWLELGMNSGITFLVDATGKPIKLADVAEAVGDFDGAGRLWYRTKSALVAREVDGTATSFPLASKPMFQERPRDTMCWPIGAGFTQLPKVGATLTGTLEVDVSGGGGLPFVACDAGHSAGVEPCINATDRITGTLDAFGHWSGVVPIANYTFAVRRGSAWLEPQPEANTTWICHLKENDRCKLKGRLK